MNSDPDAHHYSEHVKRVKSSFLKSKHDKRSSRISEGSLQMYDIYPQSGVPRLSVITENGQSKEKPSSQDNLVDLATCRGVVVPVQHLQSSCEIKHSEEFCRIVNPQRNIIIAILIFVALLGPFIFRFAMGLKLDGTSKTWGSAVDDFEAIILFVLFLNVLSFIMKLLPIICGRPTDIEASQACVLEGSCALGVCSPFVSEDEAILLRSFIGRACTVFQTVGGRHDMNGLYLDTIMNEKRIKGEAQRKHLWYSWMNFLVAMVDICHRQHSHDTPRVSPRRSTATAGRRNSRNSLRVGETSEVQLPEESDVTSRPRRSSLLNFVKFGTATAMTDVERGEESCESTAVDDIEPVCECHRYVGLLIYSRFSYARFVDRR